MVPVDNTLEQHQKGECVMYTNYEKCEGLFIDLVRSGIYGDQTMAVKAAKCLYGMIYGSSREDARNTLRDYGSWEEGNMIETESGLIDTLEYWPDDSDYKFIFWFEGGDCIVKSGVEHWTPTRCVRCQVKKIRYIRSGKKGVRKIG